VNKIVKNNKEFNLTNCQESAVKEFERFIFREQDSNFLLTGSSGVGKTSLIKNFADVLEKHNSMVNIGIAKIPIEDIFLMAPTHKAKGILAEKTGLEVHTIHSALQLKMFFDKDSGEQKFFKPKDSGILIPTNSLLVVEEASMIDSYLLDLIIKHLPAGCKTLWLGDQFQLNQVGSSNTPVFEQGIKPVVLNELTRANNSELANLVVTMRDAVITNTVPKIKTGNHTKLLSRVDFENEMIVAFNKNEDAKVLAWRNATVKRYNKLIHTSLNGSDDFFAGQQLVVNKTFKNSVGELLNVEKPLTVLAIDGAHTVVINGELLEYTKLIISSDGTFIRVPSSKYKLNKVLKTFKDNKDWSNYYATKEQYADVNDAYAISTHKSQGSSYTKVFVDLTDIMLNQKLNEMLRLLYVALTRASDEVILCKE